MNADKYLCLALTLLLTAGCGRKSDDQTTPLHRAVGGNDANEVLLLLRQGADIDAKDSSGRTPLFVAASGKTLAFMTASPEEMVSLLLDHGAYINASDKWGYSVLHAALNNGQADVAELLLTRGAYVKTQSQAGETPLHVAARHGWPKLVKLLAAKGSDVNAVARNGDTPLHCTINGYSEGAYGGYTLDYNHLEMGAVRWHSRRAYRRDALDHDHMEVVRFLIARGADVNAMNKAGETALSYAAQSGDLDLTRLLMDSGAQPNRATAPDRAPAILAMNNNWTDVAQFLIARRADVTLHLAAYVGDLPKARDLIQSGSDVNARGQAGETPLHTAVRGGHRDLIELLINSGAHVNAQDAAGWTPLHEAAWAGHEDITELLVARGAAVSARTTGVGGSDYHISAYALPGTTPLHLAVGYPEVAKVLIASGADVDAKDEYYGETPIRRAVYDGDRQVVDLLEGAGADMDLNLAAYTGYAERVKHLIEAGANVNAQDDHGRTPLHFAVLGGHADVVELLASSGANPNAAYDDVYGGTDQTPLHKAAQLDYADVARVLIAHGANVHARSRSGSMPLGTAAYFGSTSVVEVLLAHVADPNAKIKYAKVALDCAQEVGFADMAQLLGGDPGKLARGPYKVIITDPNAMQAFVGTGMSVDGVLIPDEAQLKEFEIGVRAYLRENNTPDSATECVLAHLRRFHREYSGFISKGKKYIVCNLKLGNLDDKPPENRFSGAFDAWGAITHFVYDVENKTILQRGSS